MGLISTSDSPIFNHDGYKGTALQKHTKNIIVLSVLYCLILLFIYFLQLIKVIIFNVPKGLMKYQFNYVHN